MAKQGSKVAVNDVRKMNGELFALTYGTLVVEMLKDLEDESLVNEKLDAIGKSIGRRLADDFLARNPKAPRCSSAKEIAEQLATNALPFYLGGSVRYSVLNERDFTLSLDTNPLKECVEVPPKFATLNYSQVIAGGIAGALDALHFTVDVSIRNDSDIAVHFSGVNKNKLPSGEN